MSCLIYASSAETARMHERNIDRDRYGNTEIVVDRDTVLKRLSGAEGVRPDWASVNGALMRPNEAYDYLCERG